MQTMSTGQNKERRAVNRIRESKRRGEIFKKLQRREEKTKE
jgi:hypothetical protein